MNPKHQAPRGTRDLLPADTARWQWVEDRARSVLERYGYDEIRTPTFEDYELFARTSGETSDVVQKEMYRFQDQGERDLALRPEATAGVCRAYLQHHLAGKGRVHRLWYMGPMFRYGRPQKGRYREFRQVGAEVIGTASPDADVEIVALFVDLFVAWGFSDLNVALNSVGTPQSRARYGERIREWLAPVRGLLSRESEARLELNPLRVLDSKDPVDQMLVRGEWSRASVARKEHARGAEDAAPAIVTGEPRDRRTRADLEQVSGSIPQAPAGPMPRMLDTVDPGDRTHFEAVCAGLDALGIGYSVDHGLVRGLDYYTRTAFEVHDAALGAQSALGGGGRYDGLIEMLGGPPTPAVGFSIGLDRVVHVVEQRAGAPEGPPRVFVAWMDGTRTEAQRLMRRLRQRFHVVSDLDGKAFGAQMKAAGKSGARLLVIVGEDEWTRGEVVIKDLATGSQRTAALDALEATLASGS